MVFAKTHLSVIVFILISAAAILHAAPHLDQVDECILICDKCFKNELLLDCANECLFTGGDIKQHWRNRCPHFDANLPNVQMMGFRRK